ncbi:uncharacterized protein CANTADRAFT_26276 [Suhomyces tanzawaensis NRRL Y-17324]|uniref:Uncharacterized protein n=1 Tax=Suhomyces tanzawaensis NRRL Y-17324 TaxID=984487 RepID=A0A1E4SIQ4_9ASCO|nr:uncharacterized protein CANTADRAFT_26276 [Suhomyces tanzawaensis NRRL Y-17324]ODV79312.1 hypothetical protein CANTADRAFT_26276 [Suhomyces tanzawaensis NRRL Y-17324]
MARLAPILGENMQSPAELPEQTYEMHFDASRDSTCFRFLTVSCKLAINFSVELTF